MTSIYALKPKFQALLRPLVGLLARAGVTANQVTLAACLLSVLYGAWLYGSGGEKAALLLFPAFLFFRMALNAIDGMLAREHGQKSKQGFYLNELGDIVSDSALYLPFAAFMQVPMLVVFCVFLAVIVEFSGILALGIGQERRYDGPFGKSDRALAFGILAVLLACVPLSAPVQMIILSAFIILSIISIIRRCRKALAS